jgi:hypothetical protein
VHQATLEVASNAEGVTASVGTKPKNAVVEKCLQAHLESTFRDYGIRTRELRATQIARIEPHVRAVKSYVEQIASQISPDCDPTPPRGASTKITVTAQTDDERFSITVTGTPEYAACMSEQLQKGLHDALTVRRLRDGSGADYFRIDGPVSSTTTIRIESKAARDKRIEDSRRKSEHDRRYH